MLRSPNIRLFLLLVALQSLDVIATDLFLNLGLEEANPLWANFLDTYSQYDALALIWFYKMAVQVFIVSMVTWRWPDRPDVMSRVLWFGIWLYTGVLAWNLSATAYLVQEAIK